MPQRWEVEKHSQCRGPSPSVFAKSLYIYTDLLARDSGTVRTCTTQDAGPAVSAALGKGPPEGQVSCRIPWDLRLFSRTMAVRCL